MIRKKAPGNHRLRNGFIESVFTGIFFLMYALILSSASISKSLSDTNFSRKLIFDNGVTITEDTVNGTVNGKKVEFKLSREFSIFIESYCYGDCKKEIIYKKVTFESLKRGKDINEVRISDSVVMVLNKMGFVKKIIIVRIPE